MWEFSLTSAYTYCPLGMDTVISMRSHSLRILILVLKNDHHNKSELYFEVRNIMQRFDSLVLIMCSHSYQVGRRSDALDFIRANPVRRKNR